MHVPKIVVTEYNRKYSYQNLTVYPSPNVDVQF